MRYGEYVHLLSEEAPLERAYRDAVRLMITVGPTATASEYHTLKTSVEDIRYDLEGLRRQLLPARAATLSPELALNRNRFCGSKLTRADLASVAPPRARLRRLSE